MTNIEEIPPCRLGNPRVICVLIPRFADVTIGEVLKNCDIPENACIRNVFRDENGTTIKIIFEHPSFEPVQEGESIPQKHPWIFTEKNTATVHKLRNLSVYSTTELEDELRKRDCLV